MIDLPDIDVQKIIKDDFAKSMRRNADDIDREFIRLMSEETKPKGPPNDIR